MKSQLLTTTTIAILASSAVFADAFTDQIIADLSAQGFTSIQIENGPTQVKVEASDGTQEVEFIYDRATGQVISQETEADDNDGTPGVSVSQSDEDFDEDESDNDADDESDDDDDDD